MKPILREFLGWEGPLLERVTGWLARDWDGAGVWDLSGTMLVVPTRQSGRRLREYLAGYAAEGGRGGVVVPPIVLSPDGVLSKLGCGESGGELAAGSIESLLAWVRVLMRCEPGNFPALFPVPPEERTFRWALATAREFQNLRQSLGDAGMLLADACRVLGEGFEEAARWEDLARLEGRYLKELAGHGLVDREELLKRVAAAPVLPKGVERIVMAGVVDAMPVLVQMLGAASKSVPVMLLVYAPEAERERFDEWGRPDPGSWGYEDMDLPLGDEELEVCGRPAAQAARVVDLVRQVEAPGNALALGVLDAQLLPILERSLVEAGVDAYDPEGVPLSAQGFAHLMRSLSNFLRSGTFADYLDLLRCPDYLRWIERLSGAGGDQFGVARLLRSFDDFLATAIPDDFKTGVGRMLGIRGEELSLEERAAVRAGERVLASLGGGTGASALQELLQEIYEGSTVGPASSLSAHAIEVGAARVEEAVGELSGALGQGLAGDEGLEVVLGALEGERLYVEGLPGALELQGWMELLWDDAPNLILCGMNDGLVPEAVVGDVFLPDLARRRLGLEDNEKRFARDAYLLSALLRWRRSIGGNVRITIGKTGADQEPLRPSRLLFLCSNDALVARCERLFVKVKELGPSVPWAAAWKLRVAEEKPVPLGHLSVTDFRGYLACPFRFYLGKYRDMEEAEPGKLEMNPADFGNVMHRVLESLGKAGVREATGDLAGLVDYLLEELEIQVRKTYGATLTVPLTVQVEAARQRLRKAAEVQLHAWEAGWEIEHTEWRIHEQIPDWTIEGVRLRGVIDRVERRGNKVRVLDYKTADSGDKPTGEHYSSVTRATDVHSVPAVALFRLAGKLKRWKDLQLPLYCLAARRLYPDLGAIECGYFNLPKAVDATAIEPMVVTDELLEEAERCAGEVVRAILAGRFWPPAANVRYDRFGPLLFDAPEKTIDATGLAEVEWMAAEGGGGVS
ncbi:MAG: PD-(D/E)XK nuclease family protein [Verrucomicrobiota bacterium]